MSKYQVGESVEVLHPFTGLWVEAEILQVLSEQYFVEYFSGGEGFALFKHVKALKEE
jgi:hypothetical protein